MNYLLAKKLEIDRIYSKIHNKLELSKKELEFYPMKKGSHKDSAEEGLGFNKIEKIESEVSVAIKSFLKPLNDGEKCHIAEIMGKRGLTDFIILNLREFGEVFNKILVESFNRKDNNNYMSGAALKALVKQWGKMTISDGDRQRINDELTEAFREHYRDGTGLTYNERQQLLKGHKGKMGLDDEEINLTKEK